MFDFSSIMGAMESMGGDSGGEVADTSQPLTSSDEGKFDAASTDALGSASQAKKGKPPGESPTTPLMLQDFLSSLSGTKDDFGSQVANMIVRMQNRKQDVSAVVNLQQQLRGLIGK